jgi:hypothetical protein
VETAGRMPIDLMLAAGVTRAVGLAAGGTGAGPLPPPSPSLPSPWQCIAVLSPPIIRCLATSGVLLVPKVGVVVVGCVVVIIEVVAVAVVVAMFV